MCVCVCGVHFAVKFEKHLLSKSLSLQSLFHDFVLFKRYVFNDASACLTWGLGLFKLCVFFPHGLKCLFLQRGRWHSGRSHRSILQHSNVFLFYAKRTEVITWPESNITLLLFFGSLLGWTLMHKQLRWGFQGFAGKLTKKFTKHGPSHFTFYFIILLKIISDVLFSSLISRNVLFCRYFNRIVRTLYT